MRRNDSSPEAYVADVQGEQAEMIQHIRSLIRELLPDVEEGIAHGMLDYPGLCNLAAQKNYVAVYTDVNVLASHRHLLGGVSCGKSCIRFRKLEQLESVDLRGLLKAVLEFRARRR